MPAGLHRLLLESAERAPDAVAYVAPDRRVTHGELARAVRGAARGLRDLGVGRGDRVAVLLDGTVDWILACHAALHAGASAVPLDPDVRAEPLARTLAAMEVTALACEPQAAALLRDRWPRLPSLRAVVLTAPAQVDVPAGVSVATLSRLAAEPEVEDAGAGGEDLALIPCTSGTIGHPKGVMLPHRALVANTHGIVRSLGLRAGDVAGLCLPYHHAYGASVIHTHLAVGGCIVALPSIAFPAAVLETLARERCTGFPGVPSTFARLLRLRTFAPHDLSALRYVTQAGAPLPSAVLRDLRARLPAHVAVVLMYGQTEAGARLTCLDPADLDRKPGSVGRAIPGIQLAVVDEGGVEVARGVEGELVARGDSLMAGYWRDPEQTAAVLRPEGLRTRDRAIMDDEGFVRILGRADDMIKSGGHRVAPEEIEEVIRSLPDVVECAVVGAADDLLGERLVAFVVPETRDAVDPRAVQRACLDALPRYLVPSEVVLVDALPRTPSGKLLRRALRERLSLD